MALLTAGVEAQAGPGFIAGSRINKGTYFAEIIVQFNCDVEYISHEPLQRGDQMRIYLESTGVCRGVSPLVANVREQHRPARADDAKLVNLEYDGDTAAGSILRFNFSEDVRFSIQPPATANSIKVRIQYDEQATQVVA